MTFWNGFTGGAVVGALVTLTATGQIVVVTMLESARSISILILFVIFLIGQALTLYRAKERGSFINPTADGFIVGMGWANAVIVFLLYGFRI